MGRPPALDVKVPLHHPTTIDFGVHIPYDTAGVEYRFPLKPTLSGFNCFKQSEVLPLF